MIPSLVSPDGSVRVDFTSLEMRMSLWVHEPVVVRTRDGAVLLDFDGTLLDGAHATDFPGPHRVRLRLRKYPHGDRVRYDLVVDAEAETFGLGGEPDRPLAEIGRVVPELRPRPVSPRAVARETGRCALCGGAVEPRRDLWSRLLGRRVLVCRGCGRSWSG